MVSWSHEILKMGRRLLWLDGYCHNNSCLLRGAPRLPSILLCSSLPLSSVCLATLRVDFLRNGDFRSLTRSVGVAEVTRVNTIPACRQAGQYPLSPPNRQGALHEVIRCQSSQASQSIHYPRNHWDYQWGWRLLYLVASVWMSWFIFRFGVIVSDILSMSGI